MLLIQNPELIIPHPDMVRFSLGPLTPNLFPYLLDRLDYNFGSFKLKLKRGRKFKDFNDFSLFVSLPNIYNYSIINIKSENDNLERLYDSLSFLPLYKKIGRKVYNNLKLFSIEIAHDIPVVTSNYSIIKNHFRIITNDVMPKEIGRYIQRHKEDKFKRMSDNVINGDIIFYWNRPIKSEMNRILPTKFSYSANKMFKAYIKMIDSDWLVRFETTRFRKEAQNIIPGFTLARILDIKAEVAKFKFSDFWEYRKVDYYLFKRYISKKNYFNNPIFEALTSGIDSPKNARNEQFLRYIAGQSNYQSLKNRVNKYIPRYTFDELYS